MKKLLSIVLALTMALSLETLFPISAVEIDVETIEPVVQDTIDWREYYIDPMYDDMVSEGDLPAIPTYGTDATNSVNDIKERLNRVLAEYPSGSRWTGSFDDGRECYGFAKLVIYKVFGTNSSGGYRSWFYSGVSTSGMNQIGSITNYSASNVQSLLSKAQPGDVLQFNTTKQHSMIVYGVESDGVWIYECNWDGNCGVSLTKKSFGTWSRRDSTKLTLLRSDNAGNIVPTEPEPTVDTRYPVPFDAYGSASDTKYPLYKSWSTSSEIYGYIYSDTAAGDDLCTINKIYTNGWCQVTVPWSGGGTKTGYTLTNYFLDTSFTPQNAVANGSATVYRRRDLKVSTGKVYDGDSCLVVLMTDNAICFICPWTSGAGRKMVWAPWGQSHTHTWDGGTVTKSPTCTDTGVRTYRCTGCSEEKTETIPAKGHTPGAAATCTTPQKCTVCGEQLAAALGHKWNSGTVTKQPTCTATGVKTFTCTTCGTTKTESIPAKGHTPGAAATCTTPQKCTTCGVQLVATLGHNYAGSYYDEAHPHAEYQLCTRCNARKDTGKTRKDNDCPICNPSNPDPNPSSNGKVTLSNVTVAPGGTVDVTVSLTGFPKCSTVCISNISFNNSQLKLVSGKWDEEFKKNASISSEIEPGREEDVVIITFDSDREINGNIAKLRFEASNGADLRTETITVIVTTIEDSGATSTVNAQGTISIARYKRGDVNGDGILNNKDAIYLLKHVVLGSIYPITQDADMNGDGVVNNKDAIYLLKHIVLGDMYPLKNKF